MLKDKKLFGIFNIVDVVILALIICAVIFAGIKISNNKEQVVNEQENTKETYIEFYVEEVNDFVTKYMKEGDLVKDALQNVEIGEVVELVYDKPRDYGYDSNGNMVVGHKEGYVSVLVKAKTNGKLTDNGLSINSYNYYVGKSIELRVGKTALYVKIHGLYEEEKVNESNENENSSEEIQQ